MGIATFLMAALWQQNSKILFQVKYAYLKISKIFKSAKSKSEGPYVSGTLLIV